MKSAVYRETGSDSAIEVLERPIPEVGRGHVRVRIAVSGVNPTDVDQKRGRGAHEELREPQVPNQDGAGTVDAVGEGVHGVRAGDRVWVWDASWKRSEGTAQQYVVLPAHQVVPLADHASFDVGASLGIPALTAHRALTSFAEGPEEIAPGALEGRTVLVAGGAGAVGHAAIQLARWAGAEVIATVSGDRKGELATRAGAQHVIDYTRGGLPAAVRAIGRPSLVVEVDALHNIHDDIDLIADGGGISVYTPGSSPTLGIPTRRAMTKNIQLSFILTYTTSERQKRHAVAAVAAAVAAGALQVGEEHGLPLTRFGLDEVPAALAAVADHTVGKVLVDIP